MIKKIKNILFLIIFFLFILLVTTHYISDKNIIFTNKSRTFYTLDGIDSLTVLKNDTDNIIIYKNDIEEFKKKRKKRFWEGLLTDKDE